MPVFLSGASWTDLLLSVLQGESAVCWVPRAQAAILNPFLITMSGGLGSAPSPAPLSLWCLSLDTFYLYAFIYSKKDLLIWDEEYWKHRIYLQIASMCSRHVSTLNMSRFLGQTWEAIIFHLDEVFAGEKRTCPGKDRHLRTQIKHTKVCPDRGGPAQPKSICHLFSQGLSDLEIIALGHRP